jgi:thymidine kinase
MTERGWVHVICGPMFSGKTEALLKTVRRLEIAGKNVGLFKPEIDVRTEQIISRNGLSYPSKSIEGVTQLYSSLMRNDYDYIAIDEAQFFDKTLYSAVRTIANSGIRVIVSGLDRDFLGRAFGPMGDILVEADSVDKLTAVCFVCKEEASLTQRLVYDSVGNRRPAKTDDPLIVFGGINDDVYEARCRKCWEIG